LVPAATPVVAGLSCPPRPSRSCAWAPRLVRLPNTTDVFT